MTTAGYSVDTAGRYREVAAYQLLTHPVLVVGLVISVIGTAVLWGALMAGLLQAEWWVAAGFLVSAAASGLLLVFLFATTYFPYRQPRLTVSQLRSHGGGNIMHAATFDCVNHIGGRAGERWPDRNEIVVQRMLQSAHARRVLQRLELEPSEVVQTFHRSVLPTMAWSDLAERALALAQSFGNQYVSLGHFTGAFLLHPGLAAYLRQRDLIERDVERAIWADVTADEVQGRQRRWWDEANLLDFSGIGLSWASGFTPFIDRFIHFPAAAEWEGAFGHEEEVAELITALARERQSNVLVVGAPGSGRLGVVREVNRRIRAQQAHPALHGQRIVYLHVGQLLGLAGSSAEQLAVISKALTEMERAGNIIVVLDGIGSLLGTQGEQRADLTDVLMPFFSAGNVRVVALMSTEEFHLRLQSNEEIKRLFAVVQVAPLTPEQTLDLLLLTAPARERRSGVLLPYRALRAIVQGTESVLPQTPFPEKAFDAVDELLVAAQGARRSSISEDDVYEWINVKYQVPIGQARGAEKDILLNLADIIHRQIVNQASAVQAISRAMVRARTGVRNQNRPIGAFLFLGPTGVGKTETAKALAAAYFGREDFLQRLDMSEYQDEAALSRLIGDGRSSGRLTAALSDRPFSVLLLDEFEKASQAVHQLFLQVFDEGHMTDARGDRYSFNHTIIIATSNAGAELIRQHVMKQGAVDAAFGKQLQDHILEQDIFRPELLNRFDGVITFTPLSELHIREVAKRMLQKLNKRLDAELGITVQIDEALINYLVEIGYHPEFGARPMARAIQDSVEYAVAQQLLRGGATPGQRVVLSPAQLRQ